VTKHTSNIMPANRPAYCRRARRMHQRAKSTKSVCGQCAWSRAWDRERTTISEKRAVTQNLRAASNFSANFTIDIPKTSQMATKSKKSSLRSPVSYLLTNACLAPIAFAISSCVSFLCLLSSRRTCSRIRRSRCFLLARCTDPDIAIQHRKLSRNTPKWITAKVDGYWQPSSKRLENSVKGSPMASQILFSSNMSILRSPCSYLLMRAWVTPRVFASWD